MHGIVIAVTLFLLAANICVAQRTLRDLERRYDAVILVADLNTGRLVATARGGEAARRNYYPGSLFKLAIAVAALRSGRFDRSFTYTCRGADTINGKRQTCWTHRGHGKIGFTEALSKSCNLYFRQVACSVSTSDIASAARSLGMVAADDDTGALLANLNDENILGESFSVSPAQMLQCALAIASRGRISSGGLTLITSSYRPLYLGLRECVRSGTGHEAWSRRFSMGGKTGTSPVAGYPGRTVGWFLGFAPFDEPRYAVVVLYRHARGYEAARVARLAMEELL